MLSFSIGVVVWLDCVDALRTSQQIFSHAGTFSVLGPSFYYMGNVQE